jgi:predicted nucleic acid-binding protein
MIIVDSSVWIDHFRIHHGGLAALLDERLALMHPFVLGEIALGNLREPEAVLGAAGRLPRPAVAEPAEVLNLIASAGFAGSGIGYVDAHLIASTMLTAKGRLWTRDKRLLAVAERLEIAFN